MTEIRLVDVRGLLCPWPGIRLSRIGRKMGFKGRVRVLADDPAAAADIEEICRERGWRLAPADAETGMVFHVEFA